MPIFSTYFNKKLVKNTIGVIILKISVKKSIHRPICERDDEEPWARVSDILLNSEKTRVVAVIAETESLIPLKMSLPLGSVFEWDASLLRARRAGERRIECPAPVSCADEVFRLKSAGGSRVRDIFFEPQSGGIVGVTVGGLFDKRRINIIQKQG